MFDAEFEKYQPRHVHINRRPGSSTGGISQITFGDEPENVPPPPVRAPRTPNEFAARNATSSIFDHLSEQPPAPVPRHQARLFPEHRQAAHRQATSHFKLAYDEEEARLQPHVPKRHPQAPPPRNPILFDDLPPAPLAHRRPPTAPPRYDVNKSSVAGGIFGHYGEEQEGSLAGTRAGGSDARSEERSEERSEARSEAGTVGRRRHDVNRRQADAPYKSKIIINGRIEYCA